MQVEFRAMKLNFYIVVANKQFSCICSFQISCLLARRMLFALLLLFVDKTNMNTTDLKTESSTELLSLCMCIAPTIHGGDN